MTKSKKITLSASRDIPFKRLGKTAPMPCIVREDSITEEDSLAENIQRAPLHPLDQFRVFLALKEKGQSEEEIAATFFISVNVVKQRLKLASVSPKLLDIYAEDGMTLDQLITFTVSGNHARQEQMFEHLQQSYDKQPYAIRRMLTEGSVRASDKRAQFIGVDAYVESGGTVLRDLFQSDDGGWLQDVALVDEMVTERPKRESEAIVAEGWKWIKVAPDYPYGHTFDLRQLRGEEIPLTAEEEASRNALKAEYVRSKSNIPKPTSCPTTSTRVSARSRRRSKPWRIARSRSIRTTSPEPTPSSASLMAAACASSAVSDVGPLTFLHGCISTKRHRVRTPETPMYLDALLADQPLVGGVEPRLGDEHLRIGTITGVPTAATPSLLDELNRLAFAYRWSTCAILIDKTDATRLLSRIRPQWFAKRKSVAAILKEVMTNEAAALVDTDASNKAADADLALQELGADHAGIAHITATVNVWDT